MRPPGRKPTLHSNTDADGVTVSVVSVVHTPLRIIAYVESPRVCMCDPLPPFLIPPRDRAAVTVITVPPGREMKSAV